MARNEEKAQSTLSRWRQYKQMEEGKVPLTRPRNVSQVISLKDCENWRHDIIKEIAKKIAQIQNPGLGEFRLRDLNDEINRLFREKRAWEFRIKELGGADHLLSGPRVTDQDGREVPGMRGYRYFGAAKDLPGVRELFAQLSVKKERKTKGELSKFIDADYYGYRDEDDGVIVPLEAAHEPLAIAQAVEAWKRDVAAGRFEQEAIENDEDLYKDEADDMLDDNGVAASSAADEQKGLVTPLVPSQEEIENMLLQRKKRMLLEMYASEEQITEEEQAKQLAGRA
eukprot:m.91297 g.91297  ORF g.91297 m.91297 type:complete len:283 (+) comp15296_c0_seq1:152-1000(+)